MQEPQDERIPTKVPFLDLVTPHQELKRELSAVFESAMERRIYRRPDGGGVRARVCRVLRHQILCGRWQRYGRVAVRAHRGWSQAGYIVLTVPNTFIATTEAITQAGGHPAFIDIDERTYNMDPAKLRAYLESGARSDAKRTFVRYASSGGR